MARTGDLVLLVGPGARMLSSRTELAMGQLWTRLCWHIRAPY